MEKTKKRLSKKTVIIGSVVLAVVLFGVGYGLLYYFANIWEPKEREKFTFEQITQGLSNRVSYYIDEDGEEKTEELDLDYKSLTTNRYVKVRDKDWGDLAVKILFYDENDNLLFSVKMYQYGAVYIKINDKWEYYHLCS